MKTYAIWYTKEKEESNEPAEIEVHLNLWKLPRTNKNFFQRFSKTSGSDEILLDFGIKLVKRENLSSIKVFFPFNLSKNQIKDIGKKFLTNTDLITAVFNEDYPIEIGSLTKQIRVNASSTVISTGSTPNNASAGGNVSDDKQVEPFIIYTLDIENNDCNLEYKYGGTIMEIVIPKELKSTNEPLYYRFRICTEELSETMKLLKNPGSFLEFVSKDTHIIDFRLNENRLYNRSLSEKIREEGELRFNKLHFLLMTNSQDEVMASGENPSSRQLEEDIWSKYVGEDYDISNIFAYHWKEKQPVKSHNSLIKIIVHRSGLKKLSKYLIWLAFLSIAFNIATDALKWVWQLIFG